MTINTQRIRLMMGGQDMTQADLATRSGISRQSVSAILTRGTATPKNVYRLARALDVDPAEIVAEKGVRSWNPENTRSRTGSRS